MGESALVRSIVDLESATTAEEYITAIGVYEQARARWRELEAAFKEARIAFHERNGDLELPDGRRFYVGVTKRTRNIDARDTLEALLNATGGDIDAIVECLSANAFKHGACRGPLGDQWSEHFTVEEVVDVKTGKAKQAVQIADARFITGGAS